jgi:alcohol dehydrogenase
MRESKVKGPLTFVLPRLERVIAGPDTLATLPAEVDRYGCRRALIVTGRTLAASPLLRAVQDALGRRCAGVFAGVVQHVPARTVDLLLQQLRDGNIDCLVSLGGGSPIDTAKAAAHALLSDPSSSAPADGLVHIAVPTTLSAAEFTDVAGKTDDATGIKHALSDPRIAPRAVIADPVVTLDTPAWLWAGSGIRALDHAVETLYSSRCHPISEPLAVRAIELLRAHLPRSVDNGHDVRRGGPSLARRSSERAKAAGPPASAAAHRGQCQMAAWMAVFGLTNAGSGLSHMLGHQIGPRWNVPHGVTSAIMLPHVMRFVAGTAAERFAGIAHGFGLPFDEQAPAPAALECAVRAAAFIAQFDLPTRLRDVSVPAAELPAIAAHVCDVMNREDGLGRPITRDEIVSLLAAAH